VVTTTNNFNRADCVKHLNKCLKLFQDQQTGIDDFANSQKVSFKLRRAIILQKQDTEGNAIIRPEGLRRQEQKGLPFERTCELFPYLLVKSAVCDNNIHIQIHVITVILQFCREAKLMASTNGMSNTLDYETMRKRWAVIIPIMVRSGLIEKVLPDLTRHERSYIPQVYIFIAHACYQAGYIYLAFFEFYITI